MICFVIFEKLGLLVKSVLESVHIKIQKPNYANRKSSVGFTELNHSMTKRQHSSDIPFGDYPTFDALTSVGRKKLYVGQKMVFFQADPRIQNFTKMLGVVILWNYTTDVAKT